MSRRLVSMPPPSHRPRLYYPSVFQQAEYWFFSDGQAGVNLFDAYNSRVTRLEGANDPMFENYGTKVTYKINIGQKNYSKQKYARASKGPITRQKAVQQVAQVTLDSLRNHHGKDLTDDLRYYYLLKLERVGKSTFHCIIAYSEACRAQRPSRTSISAVVPSTRVDAPNTTSQNLFTSTVFEVGAAPSGTQSPTWIHSPMGLKLEFPWASHGIHEGFAFAMGDMGPSETSHPTYSDHLAATNRVPGELYGWDTEILGLTTLEKCPTSVSSYLHYYPYDLTT